MKRILFIVGILVVIVVVVAVNVAHNQDTGGQYSGTFQLGSDSGTISLDIISGQNSLGQKSGSYFTGNAELDTSSGSRICYAPYLNILNANVDGGGNITFEAVCSPEGSTQTASLHFTGTAQSNGWQGSLTSDDGSSGTWNASKSSSS